MAIYDAIAHHVKSSSHAVDLKGDILRRNICPPSFDIIGGT